MQVCVQLWRHRHVMFDSSTNHKAQEVQLSQNAPKHTRKFLG